MPSHNLQPFEFTQLAEQGQWDERPLLDGVDSRQFGIVVLRFPVEGDPMWHAQRIDRPLRDAIARRYRLASTYGDCFLYLPA